MLSNLLSSCRATRWVFKVPCGITDGNHKPSCRSVCAVMMHMVCVILVKFRDKENVITFRKTSGKLGSGNEAWTLLGEGRVCVPSLKSQLPPRLLVITVVPTALYCRRQTVPSASACAAKGSFWWALNKNGHYFHVSRQVQSDWYMVHLFIFLHINSPTWQQTMQAGFCSCEVSRQ